MADKLFRRWGGGTAVCSLIIWLILTPFMATIWVYNRGFLIGERQPLLIRTIGHWLAERGAFSFANEDVVYFSYGRSLLQQPHTTLAQLAAHHRRHSCTAMFFEKSLTAYWPNSPVLSLVLAWAIVGVHLLVHQQLPDPNGNPPL